MKKRSMKLPKFAAATLDREQLGKVPGGLMAGTGCTKSVCHIDGCTDSD